MTNSVIETYGTREIPEGNYCGFGGSLNPKFREDLRKVVSEYHQNNFDTLGGGSGLTLPLNQEKKPRRSFRERFFGFLS